ncbi:MAG: Double zinc ribbon [Actinomycetota bacterium]|nr:Double zinc ribbon [Actinomycetota bacterium]
MSEPKARWCPSCGREWTTDTAACTDCLVELVDDLAATKTCRHCGEVWPARMKSCPNCLAELQPDPAAAAQAIAATLVRGFYLPRPAHLPPFRDGPDCTLLRATQHSSLIFVGADGLMEADVEGRDASAVPPLACRDLDGTELFRLERYQAAKNGLVAIGADGAPIGTYLKRPDLLEGIIDVRDETSAPVAILRRPSSRTDFSFELVRTGGPTVARVNMFDIDLDGTVDDQWTFHTVSPDGLPLSALAAVALLLAAKVLLGRQLPTSTVERKGTWGWENALLGDE